MTTKEHVASRIMGEATRLEMAHGHWDLPLADEPVTQLRIDYAVTFLLENGILIRIEEPFSIWVGEHSGTKLDPGTDAKQLAPVLALARSVLSRGAVLKDGGLELYFRDAGRISVPPSATFEPWEIAGPDGLLVVSVPGGDVSVWSSKPGS